jgi:putative ABC transport system ATP-binding protein
MIELKKLSMNYEIEGDRLDVLTGIDLCIDDGESIAIVGPSGSGKTTLLLLLAGLEKPCGGQISIDGVSLGDLDADNLADLRRDQLGIVFQSFHLVASLSALDNVTLPLEIAGEDKARERARDMLDQVGLAQREKHFPSQLSGGEQQRVAIARALVHSPKLVLADEPTGNLDTRTGERVGELLFDLNAKIGSTLVWVTHDEEIAKRCDRLLRMNDGLLIEEKVSAIPH